MSAGTPESDRRERETACTHGRELSEGEASSHDIGTVAAAKRCSFMLPKTDHDKGYHCVDVV